MTSVHHKTILKRLLLPIMAVMMLQAILYAIIFLQGGVLSHTDRNAFDILNERTINRKLYIENEMVHRWSNIAEFENSIISSIQSTLRTNNATISDIKTNVDLNEKIIRNVAPEIIYMLRKNMATGAFIILDGDGIKNTSSQNIRAGFYVRDLDPTNFSAGNADLLVERGLPSISKELGISLDSYWSAGFEFSDDGENANEDFFYKPLEAAKNNENKDSQNFGYWGGPFRLSPSDSEAITYSIPLIDTNGTVFGVLGVDISQNYLLSIMHYEEIANDRNGAYFLAVLDEDGKTLNKVISSGPVYKIHYGEAKQIKATAKSNENIYQLKSLNYPREKVFGSVQPFRLYNTNTPFEKEQWVLVGMVEGNHLLSFSNQIETIVYISTLISFLLGVVGVCIASNIVTKPITALVTNLRRSDPNKPIILGKIHIEEIDELTVSIENLSNAVAESASKISKIISLTGIAVGVFESQKGNPKVFCNKNTYEILGWEYDEREGDYINKQEFIEKMQQLSKYIYNEKELIFRIPRSNTTEIWVQITHVIEGDEFLGTVMDISKDMIEKQRMEYEIDYDALTNLYNRRAFKRKLIELFTDKKKLNVAALIMWDLDNLKYINDTYGHDFGDKYIVAFAQCISTFCEYQGIVARRSGDEFYVLLYGYESKDQIWKLVHEVSERIEKKYFQLPNGNAFKIRVSGGIAWYPDDSTDFEELIRYSDFAMYSVKHKEKGSIQEFDKSSYNDNFFLVSGQEALNHLIDHQLVKFVFQPILEISTGKVYGYEMLMRSMIEDFRSPLDILRIAKSQSKLYHIEKLTWFKAMDTFVTYLKAGKIVGDEKVFINSIGSQMMTLEDLDEFQNRYKDYLHRIVVEITEGEPCEENCVKRKIQVSKDWNALLAIDDYGSGYNSESSLLFFTPSVVKVDMSIVQGIDKDVNRQNVLENLISYAKKREIKVLAEGVETKEELKILISYGVDFLQGYYIGKPDYEVKAVNEKVLMEIKDLLKEIQ